ncbi:MAG TPA: ATP-binding protein [Chitinophagales bacterium]|mgnify:CR=1 FL=1|nr:ATP-binding protein [Chitinophagales bacterium]
MFIRQIEKEVAKLIKAFPSVALLGPRQVGKTTLAKNIMNKFKNTVYLDLEDRDDFNALQNPKLFFENYRNALVVIDEVQRMPELFPALRAEIDANRKAGRFLLLGSVSPDLLQKSSETLAGRIVFKELSPLLYEEVYPTITYDKHWLRGGYPEALNQKNAALWNTWHASFLRTYIEKDLPMLGLSTPALTITRLLQMLAYNQGQVLNKSEYASALGISVPTVSNILDYLSYAYLIRFLPPYFTNAKKRVVKSPKVYIRDSGMLHHLLSVTQFKALLANPKAGFSWEAYVIEQVIHHYGDEKSFYYYRTQGGTEADLVIAHYNKPTHIVEVKMSNNPTITKSLHNSMQDLGVKNASIIIPGNAISYLLEKGVKVCSLDMFLHKK